MSGSDRSASASIFRTIAESSTMSTRVRCGGAMPLAPGRERGVARSGLEQPDRDGHRVLVDSDENELQEIGRRRLERRFDGRGAEPERPRRGTVTEPRSADHVREFADEIED